MSRLAWFMINKAKFIFLLRQGHDWTQAGLELLGQAFLLPQLPEQPHTTTPGFVKQEKEHTKFITCPRHGSVTLQ